MKCTVANYKEDKYYPRVVKAFSTILTNSDVVTPIDVLITMGNLNKKNYEAWRKGQVPFLERVIEGSLSKVSRILRIIGFHAHDLNMKRSTTVYKQWGAKKKILLRFSKSGITKIETAYSTHFLWNRSQDKKPAPPQ